MNEIEERLKILEEHLLTLQKESDKINAEIAKTACEIQELVKEKSRIVEDTHIEQKNIEQEKNKDSWKDKLMELQKQKKTLEAALKENRQKFNIAMGGNTPIEKREVLQQ